MRRSYVNNLFSVTGDSDILGVIRDSMQKGMADLVSTYEGKDPIKLEGEKISAFRIAIGMQIESVLNSRHDAADISDGFG